MAVARTGGCLCGGVRYESVGEPLFSLLCHCRDCQHQSGSAYVAAMRVPAAGFRVTQGEPKLYVSASDAGNRVTRAFCPECGCPLFIRVSARPDIVGPRDVSVRTKDEDLLLVGGPEANELVRKAAQAGKISFKNLQPEGFLLKTIKIGKRSALVIGGNDEAGTLYGTYDWLERQG